MKKYFLIAVFTFLFLGLFSQDTVSHQTDTAGILKIERIVNGKPANKQTPYYIYSGQRIVVRTFSNPHPQVGTLTGVGENSFVMDHTKEFAFSDIKEISWDCESRRSKMDENLNFIAGGALLAGAAALYLNATSSSSQLGDGRLLVLFLVGVPTAVEGLILIFAGAIQNIPDSKCKVKFPRNWKISAADTSRMSRYDKPKTEKVKADNLKQK